MLLKSKVCVLTLPTGKGDFSDGFSFGELLGTPNDYDMCQNTTQMLGKPRDKRMEIRLDNLNGKEIADFLQQHIEDMKAVSPPESKHALDLRGLQAPEITFWTIYDGGEVIGCGALKEADPYHGEVKSMRVRSSARNKGIGSKLLSHIVEEARSRGYRCLKLETGSMPFFDPARRLYLKHGFSYCGPFGSYKEDPNSVFMELNINA